MFRLPELHCKTKKTFQHKKAATQSCLLYPGSGTISFLIFNILFTGRATSVGWWRQRQKSILVLSSIKDSTINSIGFLHHQASTLANNSGKIGICKHFAFRPWKSSPSRKWKFYPCIMLRKPHKSFLSSSRRQHANTMEQLLCISILLAVLVFTFENGPDVEQQ